MANERPSLGFEYEVALAKIDLTQALTFAESLYPTILGSFEVVTATRDIRLSPPSMRSKSLRCGYNPAAQVIPEASIPGTLAFTLSDRAQTNQAMTYNGLPCVARITTHLGDVTEARTIYCSYFTPKVEIRAPEGEGVGETEVSGEFTILR